MSHGCAIVKVLLFVSICRNIIVGPPKKVVHFSGSFPPTFGIMININLFGLLNVLPVTCTNVRLLRSRVCDAVYSYKCLTSTEVVALRQIFII